MSNPKKPDYGWDASPFRLVLFLLVSFGGGAGLIDCPSALLKILGGVFLAAGVGMGALGVIYVFYVKMGKMLRRDRVLGMTKWTGNEMVLDVGTGRGLLMIGAAKKLAGGRSIGIDIWNAEDMLNNSLDRTLRNAELEGVREKVEIKNEDAQSMSFSDGSFDVVLSNLCLHNIASKAGREKACREIARVLKPNGVAIISDLAFTGLYRDVFEKEGLKVSDVATPIWEGCMPNHRTIKAVRIAGA